MRDLRSAFGKDDSHGVRQRTEQIVELGDSGVEKVVEF